MLQIYDYFRSSASFRLRIALNYKQLAYTVHKVNLLKSEQLSDSYAKLNPSKLVPALITENGELLNQSLAILEYLEEEYPKNPILPSLAIERAYIRSIALDIACEMHPLNNLRVLKYLKQDLGHSEDEANIWYQHWLNLGLSSLEQKIKNSPFYNKKYCFKEHFSLADICLVPQMFNARRFNCDITKIPTLVAIEQLCLEQEWVKLALPENNQ